jgi:hypothetical protein
MTMTPLQIRHDDYGTCPLVILCTLEEGRLTFRYGATTLADHRDAVEIELPPRGAMSVHLQCPDGRITATCEQRWDNLSPDVAARRFERPITDFLTVEVTMAQANETKKYKLYVKTKPHGGLPAPIPG